MLAHIRVREQKRYAPLKSNTFRGAYRRQDEFLSLFAGLKSSSAERPALIAFND